MRKAAYFDITPKCNLRCIHCYNAEKYFKCNDYEELSIEKIKKIIDELYNQGFNYIHFLGGEPLLSSNIIETVGYCKSLKFEVSINTNATLLDESMQDKFIELGVDQIGCSVDGYDDATNDAIRGKGTFYKAIKNIKDLKNKKSNIQVQVVYTITNLNHDNIKILPALLEWLQVDMVDISLLFKAGNAIETWGSINIYDLTLMQAIEEFVSMSQNRGYAIQIDNRPIIAYYLKLKYNKISIYTNIDFTTCSAGTKNVYIEADGRIHPCNFFVAIGGREKYKDLNIDMDNLYLYERKFNEVIESDYFVGFMEKVDSMDVRKDRKDCKDCICRDICYPCPFEESNKIENQMCMFCWEKLETYIRNCCIEIKNINIFNKLACSFLKNEIEVSDVKLSDLLTEEKTKWYKVIDMLINMQNLKIIEIKEKSYEN